MERFRRNRKHFSTYSNGVIGFCYLLKMILYLFKFCRQYLKDRIVEVVSLNVFRVFCVFVLVGYRDYEEPELLAGYVSVG